MNPNPDQSSPTPQQPKGGELPTHPHKTEGCHGYYIHGVEDEMITIHSNKKFVETFFAGDPEQARDFYDKFKRQVFRTVDEAWASFVDFKATWKTKYPEDEQ